jgi:hypothetical protein
MPVSGHPSRPTRLTCVTTNGRAPTANSFLERRKGLRRGDDRDDGIDPRLRRRVKRMQWSATRSGSETGVALRALLHRARESPRPLRRLYPEPKRRLDNSAGAPTRLAFGDQAAGAPFVRVERDSVTVEWTLEADGSLFSWGQTTTEPPFACSVRPAMKTGIGLRGFQPNSRGRVPGLATALTFSTRRASSSDGAPAGPASSPSARGRRLRSRSHPA